MPTYAYRCADCGHEFDIYQSFTDDSLTTCPECEGVLRKKFGSLGVTFNGSGFYRTDSRAAAGGSQSGSGGEASSNKRSGGSDSASSGSGSSGSGGSGSSKSGGSTSSGSGNSGSSGSSSGSAAA